MKLRAYTVSCDDEYALAVIAESVREAKRIARHNDIYDMFCDCEYIDIEAKWQKDANIEGLKEKGVMEDALEALRRNIYGSLEEEKCDLCGKESYLTCVNGKALCVDCEEKLIEEAQSKGQEGK